MNVQEVLSKLQSFSVKKVEIAKGVIKLQIQLQVNEDAQKIEEEIQAKFPDNKVKFVFIVRENSKRRFKKIIGVSSGKGGVGKSTVALHLAFALKKMGHKVGILDADIYAPSIPVFLNIKETPKSQDGRLIQPIVSHGMQVLSMGMFLKDNQAAMWRGPMLSSAFSQFLEQGDWDVDYLIIDLPPGSSDIHISCSKVAPDAQMLLVGTPSKVVYSDVYRMYVTLRALNLNVLGYIENQAYSECKKCGNKEYVKTEAKLKDVQKIIELPFFHHFHALAESGYENYEGSEEIFDKLAESVII